MARKAQSDGSAEENGGSGSMTKSEAVRKALAELTFDAKPAEIQEYVREQFQMELTPNTISAYKSQEKKKSGQSGTVRRGPGRPRTRPQAPAAQSAPSLNESQMAVALEDLRKLKELASKLGPDQLRMLVDLLGKG